MADLDKIYSFLKKVEGLSFAEVSVQADDFKIRVKKNPNSCSEPQAEIAEGNECPIVTVCAPIAGTIHFDVDNDGIKLGKEVGIGQTICIIETNGVFNEIKSDVGGVIIEMLVEDDSDVEAHQKLFVLRKF